MVGSETGGVLTGSSRGTRAGCSEVRISSEGPVASSLGALKATGQHRRFRRTGAETAGRLEAAHESGMARWRRRPRWVTCRRMAPEPSLPKGSPVARYRARQSLPSRRRSPPSTTRKSWRNGWPLSAKTRVTVPLDIRGLPSGPTKSSLTVAWLELLLTAASAGRRAKMALPMIDGPAPVSPMDSLMAHAARPIENMVSDPPRVPACVATAKSAR